jgi:hypothetical protein
MANEIVNFLVGHLVLAAHGLLQLFNSIAVHLVTLLPMRLLAIHSAIP